LPPGVPCTKCGQTFVIQAAEAPPSTAAAPASGARRPPLPAAVPPPVSAPMVPMVSGVIVWTGMWFLMDTQTKFCLDGCILGRGSVVNDSMIDD
jgi:hypothetical protein